MLIITAEWHAFAIYTMMTNRGNPQTLSRGENFSSTNQWETEKSM